MTDLAPDTRSPEDTMTNDTSHLYSAADLRAAEERVRAEERERIAAAFDAQAAEHDRLATRDRDGKWTNGSALSADGRRRDAAFIRALAPRPEPRPDTEEGKPQASSVERP